MDPVQLGQSSFAALTFIAAPALLTNASSVLALSTTNRMLRTRDIMREALAKSETQDVPGAATGCRCSRTSRARKSRLAC